MAPSTHVEFARERRAFYSELNRFYVTGFTRALACALPLGLLLIPGPIRIVGYVYFGVWSLFVTTSTGAIFALLLDAVLIILNRQPLMLPQVIFARHVAQRQPQVRRAIKGFQRFAEWAAWANPLGNVVVSLMLFAIRMRPQIVVRVATMVAEWQDEANRIIIGGEPTVEYISLAIDHAIAPAVEAPRRQQRELQLA